MTRVLPPRAGRNSKAGRKLTARQKNTGGRHPAGAAPDPDAPEYDAPAPPVKAPQASAAKGRKGQGQREGNREGQREDPGDSRGDGRSEGKRRGQRRAGRVTIRLAPVETKDTSEAAAAPPGPAALAATADWDGAIEAIDRDNRLHGWAVITPSPSSPPVVEIHFPGGLIARAVAEQFRPRLFAPPARHGHHGFSLSLPAGLRPGFAELILTIPGLPGARPARLTLPPPSPRPRLTVEALLTPPARWQASDLLAHPDPLGLDPIWRGIAATIPPDPHRLARLVDALYQFVLGRFPGPAEFAATSAALLAGQVAPSEMLRDLLTREPEFKTRPDPLPAPFDVAFPFTNI